MKRFLLFILSIGCGLCLKAQITTSDIIYECNPRMFAANQSLQAVEQQLDRLQQLGVSVLWVMPVFPRGNDRRSCGSPYCVSDYRAIYSSYGSMDDMISLVNACHKRGIRVIQDWVANHTAWDHAWVSAHSDWYTAAQTDSERLWNDVTFLNYNNANMRAAMLAEMRYWVQTVGVDGFRCDYAEGVPTTFWSDAISQLKQVNPNLIFLAEGSQTNLYTAGFDILYSWDYLADVQRTWAHQRSFSDLFQTSNNEFRTTPSGHYRMRYITTHDASSEHAPSDYYQSGQGALAAYVLTLFEGGIPMLYSSQEMGNVSQINFLGNSTPVISFNSQSSIHAAYQHVHQIWHQTASLRQGVLSHPATSNAEVACVRYDLVGQSPLIVVVNRSSQSQTATVAGISESFSLPAYGYQIRYDTAQVKEQCYLYVQNQTNWSQLYMYAWTTKGDTEGDAFTGPWPGMQASGTVVLGGVTYLVFPIPSDGNYMLIFNNGQGTQLKDLPISGGQTYYVKVTASGTDILPQPMTGLDSTTTPSQIIRKVFFNGRLYLVRGTELRYQLF